MFAIDDVPCNYVIKDATITTSSSEDIFISGSEADSAPCMPIPAPRRSAANIPMPTPDDNESESQSSSAFLIKPAEGSRPSPAKRKKSVRELLSKFQGSPPKSEDEKPQLMTYQQAKTPDLPSKPQGPMSLPTEIFHDYDSLHGSKSMEISHSREITSPTCDPPIVSKKMPVAHSRRSHETPDIPMPIQCVSPPLP